MPDYLDMIKYPAKIPAVINESEVVFFGDRRLTPRYGNNKRQIVHIVYQCWINPKNVRPPAKWCGHSSMYVDQNYSCLRKGFKALFVCGEHCDVYNSLYNWTSCSAVTPLFPGFKTLMENPHWEMHTNWHARWCYRCYKTYNTIQEERRSAKVQRMFDKFSFNALKDPSLEI